jgi:membrane-bound metal-dependent hydrolase YbcI (DUF457 family)
MEENMPQAGIHGIVGVAFRKWMPRKEWLLLGVVLGNLFPDLDNIAVAVATVTRSSTEGLHRTFTHSLFTLIALVVLFYLVSLVTRDQKWNNFGMGFGIGILMHIVLDLFLWFNGVELFWPIKFELNFWSWFTMPGWLDILLKTGEFLAFGMFFLFLASIGTKQKTDEIFLPKLRTYAYIQFGLFILFSIAGFVMQKGFMTIYGALYLLSLFFAIGISIRMKKTIEVV